MFTDFITEEEDYILTLRFRPMTLEEVAALTGYSRQRVRLIEAHALRVLDGYGFGIDVVVQHYNADMAERRRQRALEAEAYERRN
jgi:hypothetical protein